MKASESGASLLETLISMAIFCAVAIPLLALLHQAALGYGAAYGSYRAGLELERIVEETQKTAQADGLDGYEINFENPFVASRYECVVIVHSASIAPHIYHTPGSSWAPGEAQLSHAYSGGSEAYPISGAVTGLIRNKKSGAVQIQIALLG
jgi:Tfp pilus assembly protein PilV